MHGGVRTAPEQNSTSLSPLQIIDYGSDLVTYHPDFEKAGTDETSTSSRTLLLVC